jgi:MFS family permease
LTDGTRLIAACALMGAWSNFHRNALGVIAPELAHDLGLDATGLGAANGAFFVALAVLQVPIGLAFDRHGARRVVAVLALLGAGGAAVHALAFDATSLIVARLAVGAGSAASFMAGVVLAGRWFPGAALATQLGRVFAFSQAGNLLAATPLAWLAGAAGWRTAFVVAGALTAGSTLLWLAWVQDDPPGAGSTRRHETLRQAMAGLRDVLRTKGLANLLALHAFAYAAVAALLGLWAAPWLHARYGLDPIARGHVLSAMTLASALGVLGFGPLDRRVGQRKRLVMAAAGTTMALFTLLAAWSQPPLWVAISVLCLVAAVGSYSVLIVAHGRSLFPDALAGRGVTTVNLGQVSGAVLLPVATGAIVAASADGYRAAFALIALCLAGGLACYSRVPEPANGPASPPARH